MISLYHVLSFSDAILPAGTIPNTNTGKWQKLISYSVEGHRYVIRVLWEENNGFYLLNSVCERSGQALDQLVFSQEFTRLPFNK